MLPKNTKARTRFYQKHGRYVVTKEGPVVFRDGAIDENSGTGMGRLIPPPVDRWERAKNKCVYWDYRVRIATQEFVEFRDYLNGTGCPVPGVDTEEEKLAHLKKLRTRVQTTKRHLRDAKQAVTESEPEVIRHHRKMDADEERRHLDFMDEVDTIRI